MAAVPSELLGFEKSVGQINKQPQCHEAGERVVENHGMPSQHIAGINVGDRQREEDKPDRQYGNVHHGSALRMRV